MTKHSKYETIKKVKVLSDQKAIFDQQESHDDTIFHTGDLIRIRYAEPRYEHHRYPILKEIETPDLLGVIIKVCERDGKAPRNVGEKYLVHFMDGEQESYSGKDIELVAKS